MATTLLLSYGLGFVSAALFGALCYPRLARRLTDYINEKVAEANEQLGEMFMEWSHRRMWAVCALAPVVLGALGWLTTGKAFAGAAGAAVGLIAPGFAVQHAIRERRKKFHVQLVDGLLLLSSSLKAGLSMLQAFTVLAEEMPPPISQEFGLLLKEARMGVNLDEALAHLKKRMPSDDSTLFVTAVLVAREAGGDITHIFSRLVETLRERKKIKERITSLTFMARMQGFLMGMLPFVFAYLVYQMDHNYFRFFVSDPNGQLLLAAIITLQAIGALLFFRFSRSPL